MKKLIILMSICIVSISCNDDDVSTRGVSSITNYPIITITGDDIVVITEGDTYEDAGAIALAGSQELTLTTTGSVDTTTPGVYKIVYSASNDDGFKSEQTRTVIVLSSAPSIYDLEGTFLRNGNQNHVVQISDRVYTADNAGGLAADATNLPNHLFVTFYNIDDQQLYIPRQLTPSGITVESTNGTIISNDNFTWVLIASGVYGTAVRNFTRL